MASPARDHDAVLFDLGGVVLPSPFEAWAEYEAELGIEVGSIRRVVAASGDDGAWARHERGEVDFAAFTEAFDRECAAAEVPQVSAVEVMLRLGAARGPRPEMIAAIRAIRAAGLRTGALTNNWAPIDGAGNWAPIDGAESAVEEFARLFDTVVESAVEGIRKPDPRIYLLACERLGVEPARVVFLDDLGVNLKPARVLGMATIKVLDAGAALAELEGLLGLPLREPGR